MLEHDHVVVVAPFIQQQQHQHQQQLQHEQHNIARNPMLQEQEMIQEDPGASAPFWPLTANWNVEAFRASG